MYKAQTQKDLNNDSSSAHIIEIQWSVIVWVYKQLIVNIV